MQKSATAATRHLKLSRDALEIVTARQTLESFRAYPQRGHETFSKTTAVRSAWNHRYPRVADE